MLISRGRACIWLTASVLLWGLAPILAAQVKSPKNPYTAREDVLAGKRLYRPLCAECHGLDAGGTPGAGPSITVGSPGRTADVDIYEIVRDGIPGTSMPGWNFSERERWQIVAYLQSLREGRLAKQARGDIEAGAALFRGNTGCLECHTIHGHGGRRGPDLSSIGHSRSPEEIENSIVRPNDKVSPGYWRVRVFTKDGGLIMGRRLNEDTFSLQLLDSEEQLLSVMKNDLQKVDLLKDSAMPSYEGRLSQRELKDLVAYLATLGPAGVRP